MEAAACGSRLQAVCCGVDAMPCAWPSCSSTKSHGHSLRCSIVRPDLLPSTDALAARLAASHSRTRLAPRQYESLRIVRFVSLRFSCAGRGEEVCTRRGRTRQDGGWPRVVRYVRGAKHLSHAGDG